MSELPNDLLTKLTFETMSYIAYQVHKMVFNCSKSKVFLHSHAEN